MVGSWPCLQILDMGRCEWQLQTLAYYDMKTITAIKSFKVHAFEGIFLS